MKEASLGICYMPTAAHGVSSSHNNPPETEHIYPLLKGKDLRLREIT